METFIYDVKTAVTSTGIPNIKTELLRDYHIFIIASFYLNDPPGFIWEFLVMILTFSKIFINFMRLSLRYRHSWMQKNEYNSIHIRMNNIWNVINNWATFE